MLFLGVTNDKVSGIITPQKIVIISPFLAVVSITLQAIAFLVDLNAFTILVKEPSDFWLRVPCGIAKQLCLPQVTTLDQISFIT